MGRDAEPIHPAPKAQRKWGGLDSPGNDKACDQAGSIGKAKTTRFQLPFPSPQSVKGRVLGDLLSGRRITHLDTWREHGSSRLAHHVYVLRGIGWPIEMEKMAVATSDGGRPATIGEYYLTEETISSAGQPGHLYAKECARINAVRRGETLPGEA